VTSPRPPPPPAKSQHQGRLSGKQLGSDITALGNNRWPQKSPRQLLGGVFCQSLGKGTEGDQSSFTGHTSRCFAGGQGWSYTSVFLGCSLPPGTGPSPRSHPSACWSCHADVLTRSCNPCCKQPPISSPGPLSQGSGRKSRRRSQEFNKKSTQQLLLQLSF